MVQHTRSSEHPFLDVRSFEVDSASADAHSVLTSTRTPSPFLSIYGDDDAVAAIDTRSAEYVTFLSELQDPDFDAALLEVMNEAAALFDQGRSPSAARNGDDRFIAEYLDPLVRELERELDDAAARFGDADAATVDATEIERFFDEYRPSVPLAPRFDQLFGSIIDKVKSVTKRVASAAKAGAKFVGKLALGPFILKLKALLRPMLQHALRYALGRLPVPLQPIARTLASKLGVPLSESPELDVVPPLEVPDLQEAFDERVADLLFATSGAEQDLEVSRAAAAYERGDGHALADLDAARQRLVSQLARLEEGDDPEPAIAEFLPAVLPLLKIGTTLLGGRSRLVDTISKLLVPLVTQFIGGTQAKALSRALVDAGLKLVNLEIPARGEVSPVHDALAGVVEDTIRRVGDFPEYVLDDREMFEAFAVEAFEQAARVGLPPFLAPDTYMRRPDLRETTGLKGVWIKKPAHGPVRYRKFSCTPRARITPQKAAALQAAGGQRLADVLEEQFGLAPGAEVEADVHLFESVLGSSLPDIARLERDTPGLGTADPVARQQLHPLTPAAAGLLLEEPALGVDTPDGGFEERRWVEPGERFYYLEIPGVRPITVPSERGAVKMPRLSRVRIVLDFPAREIRVGLYLGEARAQRVAQALRDAHTGRGLMVLRDVLDRGLRTALRRTGSSRIKIVHEAIAPAAASSRALGRLPALVLDQLRDRLREWLLTALARFVKAGVPRVIETVSAADEGLTFVMTIPYPAGLDALRQVLKGRLPSIATLRLPEGTPDVRVDVKPGFAHV